MKIPLFYFESEYLKPFKKHASDAGWDLKSKEDINVAVGKTSAIPTGVSCVIPEGYVGIIKIRSGISLKGLDATAGVIDSDYRGEIIVLVQNHTDSEIKIEQGERVAQIMVIPCLIEAELLSGKAPKDTERGIGGFGSTGNK